MPKEARIILKNGKSVEIYPESIIYSNGRYKAVFTDRWAADYSQGELEDANIECIKGIEGENPTIEFSTEGVSRVKGEISKSKNFFEPVDDVEKESHILALAIPKDPELLLKHIADLMDNVKHDMEKKDLMKAMALSFCKDMVPQYGPDTIQRIIMFIVDHY